MKRRAGSNVQGLERTLRALEPKLDEDDEALVALARGLAAAVDSDPGNAALWREYRAAVTALGLAGTDKVDDDTREFLLTVRTPRAALGDGSDA